MIRQRKKGRIGEIPGFTKVKPIFRSKRSDDNCDNLQLLNKYLLPRKKIQWIRDERFCPYHRLTYFLKSSLIRRMTIPSGTKKPSLTPDDASTNYQEQERPTRREPPPYEWRSGCPTRSEEDTIDSDSLPPENDQVYRSSFVFHFLCLFWIM